MIFEFECHERDGPIKRKVRLMDRSISHICDVVNKLETVRNFFHPAGNPYDIFLVKAFVFFEVDDVGIIWCENYQEEAVAYVNITFWDSRLRGREILCKTLTEWAYSFLQKPLQIHTQLKYRTLVAFAQRCGYLIMRTSDEGDVWLQFPNYPR